MSGGISGGSDVRGNPHPKTSIVVPVVRVVPVAVRTARVVRFIVERPTTQHTGACLARPFTCRRSFPVSDSFQPAAQQTPHLVHSFAGMVLVGFNPSLQDAIFVPGAKNQKISPRFAGGAKNQRIKERIRESKVKEAEIQRWMGAETPTRKPGLRSL